MSTTAGVYDDFSTTIDVTNVAPTALIDDVPETVASGVPFDVSAFSEDPSVEDTSAGFTYTWSMEKDGATVSTSSSPSARLLAVGVGAYSINLTVRDRDGGVSWSTSDFAITAGITPFYWQSPEAVPAALEDTTGVGLFSNGDDNELGLAKVVLTKVPDSNYQYRIERSSNQINVWADEHRTIPLLAQTTGVDGLTAPIAFSGESRVVWIDWDRHTSEQAPLQQIIPTLILQFRGASGDNWTKLDDIRVRQTHSLVVGFGGHTQSESAQNGGDQGVLWRNAGMATVARELRGKGYTVQTFSEDPKDRDIWSETVNPQYCGEGVFGRPDDPDPSHRFLGAYNFIVHMLQHNWGLINIALYGYSHGASSVRLLTYGLHIAQLRGIIGNYNIAFTGYVDGVRLPWRNEAFVGNDGVDAPHRSKHVFANDVPPVPDLIEYDEEEYRFPYETANHLSIYQRGRLEGPSGVADLRGGPLNPLWIGPTTQILDAAPEPDNFTEVNINDPATYDAFLSVAANQSWDQSLRSRVTHEKYAPLAEIDHTDGPGGGLGPLASRIDRAIDRHPVVHQFLIHYLTQALPPPAP